MFFAQIITQVADAVRFLITDLARSKSLYQMVGFVGTVFPAMVKRIFKVNCRSFGHTWRVCRYKKLIVNLQFSKFFAKINEAFNHLENVKRYYI